MDWVPQGRPATCGCRGLDMWAWDRPCTVRSIAFYLRGWRPAGGCPRAAAPGGAGGNLDPRLRGALGGRRASETRRWRWGSASYRSTGGGHAGGARRVSPLPARARRLLMKSSAQGRATRERSPRPSRAGPPPPARGPPRTRTAPRRLARSPPPAPPPSARDRRPRLRPRGPRPPVCPRPAPRASRAAPSASSEPGWPPRPAMLPRLPDFQATTLAR